MSEHNREKSIRCILFDYGGVIAEEGFRTTFESLSLAAGKPANWLPHHAMDAVYRSGYVTGQGSEATFWQELQREFALPREPAALRGEILRGFVLRPQMMGLVRRLRTHGLIVALLSDQTDWLAELDRRDHFLHEFDHIFNSYQLGKGKRDPSLFSDVIDRLGLTPAQAVFVDDSQGNIERARAEGLHTILHRDTATTITALEQLLGMKLNEAGR
jgi:HAD superfamily hydrolase (TIGR01509 family)